MNKIRTATILAIASAVMLTLAQPVWAAPQLVSTIQGSYNILSYDTPALQINNTTCVTLDQCYTFTNVTLTLTGYQGQNNGNVQSMGLANMSGGITSLIWSLDGTFQVSGDMFTNDYDDSNPLGSSYCSNIPDYDPSGTSAPLCGKPGNFYVTLSATLQQTSPGGLYNGQSIFSQFSPDNNATCTPGPCQFIGWEGLDPQGYSESIYDTHTGQGPNGVLANIYIGTAPPITPEPGSLVLFGTGLIGVATQIKRRLKK